MPDGTTAYTRDGSFETNLNGQLTTAAGFPVQPAITIPPNATTFNVGSDGVVTITTQGTTAPTQIGALQTANS